MVRYCPSISGVLGCCILAACAPFTFAASPIVVESRTSDDEVTRQDEASARQPVQGRPRELPFQPPVEEERRQGASTGAGQMQYELQLLQQEVRQLRGQVEQLQNEISRMKATQEDRYLELDDRFQRLAEQRGDRGAAEKSAPMDLDVSGAGMNDVVGSGGAAAGNSGAGEDKMYERGLEMIRNRQYEQAIDQLRETIKQYPEGEYTPNAYYWLGEVYAAKPEPEYEKARQALAQVISFFPEHNKAADAAFKLGKVYHLMGDCQRAKDILTQVVEQQQGRSVANLAESYLRDKVNCE